HRRPVHGLGAVEVAADLTIDAPAPARLRGERAGALERPPRALPPARRAGEHPRREHDDRGAVLPPAAAAGARPGRAAAGRDDAEGAVAAAPGGVVARGALGGCVPAAPRRPGRAA